MWTVIHLTGLKCGLFRIAFFSTGRAAMHQVVPNLTELDLRCARLHGSQLFWTGRDRTGLSCSDCTTLHCTLLDQTRLLLTYMDLGYAGYKCTQLEGNVWNWMRTSRIERNGSGLDGHRLHSVDWTGVHVSRVDWTRLSRTALQRTELDGTALRWTRMSKPELEFTRLHQTALQYPGLNWKVPYRTVSSLHLARLICTELHCTFPNETDIDCTSLS